MKTLTLFCVVLAVFACHTFAQSNARNDSEYCPPDGGNGSNSGPDLNADKDGQDDGLCASFQDVLGLIDHEALVALIDTHSQCDAKFRKAIRFFNTPGHHRHIELILDIFACIALRVPQVEKSCDCSKVKMKNHSFIADLLALMPKSDVHGYSVDAQSKNSNFALFSRTFTSTEFQATLRANIKKHDVASALNILRRNGWDILELLRAMITILTW
ncbi:uncharacterized protein LOC117192947 [Drosophila miranda]|uniref:uncharacterized protein LOC117192947 n=1 Tax=Drosophila miranda TaxID=7229 RepID=UPI00143F3899|nr:uncharacterized protein LOC117192947 [Drosophila miranda]